MKELMRISGFTAYVLVIVMNAMTDLGHKILIQNVIFKHYAGDTQIALTGVVNALILLPFLLLFTPSGFLADRFAKNTVLKVCAAASVPMAILITFFYYQGMFWAAFGMTLLLAAQSALYSPAKYGYIKELVGNERLAAGNAVVQAVTIVAILAGAVIFSGFFEHLLHGQENSPQELLRAIAPCGWFLIAATIAETVLTFFLPTRQEGDPNLLLHAKTYLRGHYLRDNIQLVFQNRTVWLSIVGLSVFWGINQVLFAAFGAHLKAVSGENNTVIAQQLLALGGVGIIVGSIMAGKISRKHIETGIIPLGAFGMTISLFVLPGLTSIPLMGALLFFYGICGGLLIVPLNALIQFSAADDELGKVLAGNNFVQNLAMVAFLGSSIAAAVLGVGSIPQFLILGGVAFVGSLYTLYQLPQSILRVVLRFLASQRYALSVSGLDNLPAQGGVLLLGNHVSYIDWAILSIACPRRIRFVMDRDIYERWYLRPLLRLLGAIPISPRASKTARATIAQALKNGECVALFPEGALSRNGQLGEFKRGYEDPAREADCMIIPFYLRGLWGSSFSHAKGVLQRTGLRGSLRDVTVSFGAPMPANTEAAAVKEQVFRLSITAWKEYATTFRPLHETWMQTAKRHPERLAVADASGARFTQSRLLATCLLLSRIFGRATKNQECIGVLLPASSAGTMATLALFMRGKCVTHINYTSSAETVRACLERAKITTVISSPQFLTRLQAKGIDTESMLQATKLLFMEDIKEQITKKAFFLNLMAASLLPCCLLRLFWCRKVSMQQTAAILFSSGSEGTPKGVMLSHENILGNIRQMAEIFDARDTDVVLGSLPLFHAFGLTVTTLMPLMDGLPLVCVPDPTDGLAIGKAAARYRATFLCGTPTFLGLYTRNRKLHPLMFASLRLVVAGAERLSADVRDGFFKKFGLEILEGYGTTETTPVAAVNARDVLNPDDFRVQYGRKDGTVGLPLPGSAVRIVDPQSLEELPHGEEGLVLIGGPQIMQGYLHDPEKTAAATLEEGQIRWYKTGDKGRVDEDGFLTIVDRYSRFAKIGGEMVSLSAVENALEPLLPEGAAAAAVAVPHPRKGEQIIALLEGTADLAHLRQNLLDAKIQPLLVPSHFFLVDALPRLGTGKRDLGQARKLGLERMQETKEEKDQEKL